MESQFKPHRRPLSVSYEAGKICIPVDEVDMYTCGPVDKPVSVLPRLERFLLRLFHT